MVNGSDASFMFGDNFLVVNYIGMPSGKLQRRYHILDCHGTREAQAKGIIKFLQMNGNENPADILTKIRASNTWFHLIKPLLFCHGMDFLKEQVFAKGSENRSSTPPLFQAKGAPQKSFKLDLWHILDDCGYNLILSIKFIHIFFSG